ncbi:MAG TPA: AsmA family protein [Terriglobia bacterium]|nr:AsmA family protein [Terriglobia bacterium]
MSKGRKILFGLLILLVVMVLAVVIIVPLLVNVDRYRPEVVDRVQAQTGKPVEIGRLSLSLFPSVAIRMDDFALGNPKGFPQGQFVKTKRIDVVVDGWALLHRQIVIKSLKLEQPEITLLQSSHGQWNFESQEQSKPVKKVSETSGSASTFTLGVINQVTVTSGHLSVSKLTASGRAEAPFFESSGFSSELEEVDLNAFGASLSNPFAPPHENQMASAPWWGAFVVHAQAGGQPAAHGTLKAESLRFQTLQVTSVKTNVRLYPKEVYLDDLDLSLYEGHAKGNVEFNFADANPRYKVKTQIAGVDVAKFLQEIPSARGYMTGKMKGDLNLDGEVTGSSDPLAGMRGTGNLSVKDGNLPKLQLNKNLMQLAKLSNLGASQGDPGAFSSIAADLNIANGKITSNKINVVGNGLDAQGAGSMTLAGPGSLDYNGVANLAAGSNGLTSLLAGMSGATLANGKMSLPFGIGGTLSVPKFALKSMGSANQLNGLQNLVNGQTTSGSNTNQQQNPASLIQGLAGAFKKKKNP